MTGSRSFTLFFLDVIIILLALAAIVVSALVGYIGLRKRSAVGPDKILLVLMSFMDMLMGFTWLLSITIKMFLTQNELKNPNSIICILQSSFYMFTLEVSSDCALFLAILRFLVIVVGFNSNRSLWIFFSFCAVISSLIFAALSYHYQLITPMPSYLYCMPVTLKPIPFAKFYGIWLFGRIIMIPLVIVFCYSAISLRYYTFLSRLTLPNDSNCFDNLSTTYFSNKSSLKLQVKKTIISSVCRLIFASIAYLAIFLPTAITCILQFITRVPNEDPIIDTVTLISTILIMLVNPIFAIVAHDETRHELCLMFGDNFQSSLPKLNYTN